MTSSLQAIVSDAYRTGKFQALIAVMVFGIGLVVGVVLFVDSFRDRGTQTAYAAAPVCSSPTPLLDSQACKYEGTAKLMSTARDNLLEVKVALDSLPGRSFTTSFPLHAEPAPSDLVVGSMVPITLWGGKITEVAGKFTVDSPQYLAPGTEVALGLFFGLASLVGLGLTTPLVLRAWRNT